MFARNPRLLTNKERRVSVIIDIHGHYTTAPPELDAFRGRQMSSMNRPNKPPLKLSDEKIVASMQGHIEQMDERGTDVVFFSPRAASMGHDVGSALISLYWTQTTNDLIKRVTDLFPDRFIPVCSLPQTPGVSPKNCVEELERCVKDLGFVGCNVNPDVSGGIPPFTPPLSSEWWYPLWEKLVELKVPAMIHASSTQLENLHVNGSHYIAQDYAAVVELCMSNVFDDFPDLKLIVPHGGGSIPFQWRRNRSLWILENKRPFEEMVKNLYFDTSVYDDDSIEMLVRKMGVDNVVYGAELFGTAMAIDPKTGKYFDDNIEYVRKIAWLTEADKTKIFEQNAYKLFPRAKARLDAIKAKKK